MPITYELDFDANVVYAEVSGNLTVDMTTEYFERLQQDPDVPSHIIEVVDFDKVTDFTISYGQMRSITQRYQAAKSGKEILERSSWQDQKSPTESPGCFRLYIRSQMNSTP